ncbi:hypothetical protein COLO4_17051 [Corchorus olitorius]|uniref:Uncharacterized protein n=1 Tax=Corchorus olitorius TaxID=93759 RepID=A0A1R3JEG4_9ROSI|nr:hypothetical protein COLO4_17051 [Corchorus olitorius]
MNLESFKGYSITTVVKDAISRSYDSLEELKLKTFVLGANLLAPWLFLLYRGSTNLLALISWLHISTSVWRYGGPHYH